MKKSEFISLLQHPEKINSKQYRDLNEILLRYPYFQSALSLYLKYLKREKTVSRNNLANVAAHTTDRNILFDFIEEETADIFHNLSDLMQPAYEINISARKNIHTDIEKSKNLKKPVSNKPKEDSIQGNQLNDIEIIEKFLSGNHKIIPAKNQEAKPDENIKKSVEERQTLMTETLANLYVKQEKYEKAMQAFKILSLKYPKKSSYFAVRIFELKQKIK